MRVQLQSIPAREAAADALGVICFDKESPGSGLTGLARQVSEATDDWLEEIYQSGEFQGKAYETAVLHRPAGMQAKRLAAVGGGSAGKFTPAEARTAAGALVRHFQPKGLQRVGLALDESHVSPAHVSAAVEGAILGVFEPDLHKTSPDKKALAEFFVLVPQVNSELEEAVERAQIVAEAQNFTRTLVMEPANLLTPSILAERARNMAAETGLSCEILDQDRMRQLGMGALLGVALGSDEPPALIILRYVPEGGAPEDQSHLGLVGKGVTFDTGGVSIKPSEGMEKMKYDMAGGAAVLGAMQAIARLKPRIPVTAFVPAVENMVSGRAQRPGDIVRTLSWKTVEVLNTDAEGRMVLADAITYAKRLGCTHLIDAATLTGAIVVALGYVHVGAFTNSDELLARVLTASRAQGEKMWHMPLDEEYRDLLKSAFADLPNIGGRWGGAISAAFFLKEFAEQTPWVHLDIAGTAWLEEGKPFLAKGPTGVAVRTFVELALSWDGKGEAELADHWDA